MRDQHRPKEISTIDINMKAPKPKKETPSLEPMRDQHRPKEISTIDIIMKALKPKKETPSLEPMRNQHRPKEISTMNINMKGPKPKESSQPRSLVCQKCVNNIYSNDMNRHHQREREKATIEEKKTTETTNILWNDLHSTRFDAPQIKSKTSKLARELTTSRGKPKKCLETPKIENES